MKAAVTTSLNGSALLSSGDGEDRDGCDGDGCGGYDDGDDDIEMKEIKKMPCISINYGITHPPTHTHTKIWHASLTSPIQCRRYRHWERLLIAKGGTAGMRLHVIGKKDSAHMAGT